MTYPIVMTSSNCSLLCATKRIVLNHCPVDSNGKAAGGTSTHWVMFTKLGMLCVCGKSDPQRRIATSESPQTIIRWGKFFQNDLGILYTYASSLIITSYVSIILGFLSIHISEASQNQYHKGHSPKGWNQGSSSKNIDPMVNSGGIKYGGSLSLVTWLVSHPLMHTDDWLVVSNMFSVHP